jgi:hypothetical protein
LILQDGELASRYADTLPLKRRYIQSPVIVVIGIAYDLIAVTIETRPPWDELLGPQWNRLQKLLRGIPVGILQDITPRLLDFIGESPCF